MNHLTYKGYIGSIEYSKEDGLLFGKVQGIKSLISYEGESGEDLEEDFQEAIDAYLEYCEDKGVEPEQAYKGSFNVRVSSELHAAIALKAKERMTSLNNFVKAILEKNIGYDDKELSVVVTKTKRTVPRAIKIDEEVKLKSRRTTAKAKTKARAKTTARAKSGTRSNTAGKAKKKSVKK